MVFFGRANIASDTHNSESPNEQSNSVKKDDVKKDMTCNNPFTEVPNLPIMMPILSVK